MLTMIEKLEKYYSKRDFTKTPEPKGFVGLTTPEQPRFVIQKHAASRLHFDLRLEIEGVLKSWAIPKGPSLDPRDKRLAVETEDHPLEYAEFEGIIPAGEYGGGVMMIWDEGIFENISHKSLAQSLIDGLLEINLQGHRVKGGFALKRFKVEKNRAQWLLIKMQDEMADAGKNLVDTQDNSIRSNRTLDEIRAMKIFEF